MDSSGNNSNNSSSSNNNICIINLVYDGNIRFWILEMDVLSARK